MDLQEVGWGITVFINVAQDKDRWLGLVNKIMNLGVQ